MSDMREKIYHDLFDAQHLLKALKFILDETEEGTDSGLMMSSVADAIMAKLEQIEIRLDAKTDISLAA